MSNFISAGRATAYLLPPSVDEWRAQDHLARFVVEAIVQLELSELTRKYVGCGSKAHHPATLLALLVYGYASGVFSSRELERATYGSVAFRVIAGNPHPDHDTLASFRSRFVDEIAALFVQMLQLAQEVELLQLGTVCLDAPRSRSTPHATARSRTDTSPGCKVSWSSKLMSSWPWPSKPTARTSPMA